MTYERDRPKKWCCCIVLGIIGLLVGFLGPFITDFLTDSAMQRKGLDDLAEKYYGDTKITDALPHEVLMVAYNYNDRQPRLFSKRFNKDDPGIYNVTIA